MNNAMNLIVIDPKLVVSVPDGCSVSPSCLTCPLDSCEYEAHKPKPLNGGYLRAVKRDRMVEETIELIRNGKTWLDIVKIKGVSERSVRRWNKIICNRSPCPFCQQELAEVNHQRSCPCHAFRYTPPKNTTHH